MSNVKAGDLARVFTDPFVQGILNLHVLVMEETANDRLSRRIVDSIGGPVWLVELLESRIILDYGRRVLLHPGKKLVMSDRILRRIDPPEDWKELYIASPKEETPA